MSDPQSEKVTDEAQAYVPLFIMTSEQNDAETRAFLKEHDYFGYSADNVHFFRQETEPAVDENGKIFMSAPDQIVLAQRQRRLVLFHAACRSAGAGQRDRHRVAERIRRGQRIAADR
ncbi:MAG: UTP--glucose-1-phosphate uridylyltransferase [Ruminococcus sp.]